MQKINMPNNKKRLTKVKEQWFQEGLVFRQIIDYNKVKGVSMWSKDQKQYLDNLETRLSNKIDQVEIRLNHKIEQNSLAIKANKLAINKVQSSVDEILIIIKNINQRLS